MDPLETKLPSPLHYTDSINMDFLRRIAMNVFEHPYLKGAVSLGALYVDWVFGAKKESLLIIGVLILLDTVTGFMKAFKKCRISSASFFRTAIKCFVYFILLTTAACVDKTTPVPFALVTMATYLSITEALSIVENLGAMGYPVPAVLVGRLKALRETPLEVKNVRTKKRGN